MGLICSSNNEHKNACKILQTNVLKDCHLEKPEWRYSDNTAIEVGEVLLRKRPEFNFVNTRYNIILIII